MTDTPTTEVALRHEGNDSWIDVVGPVAKLADYISRTDFVPKAMRGNAPAVAATILTGRELNMGPLTSLRSLDTIEGSVQMKTKATLARIFQAGHRVEWIEATDKACEVRIERGDGLTTAQVRWTMADAQRADLTGKAVWRRYPRAMLRNRALSECAELACPDVILGLEVGDDVPTMGGPSAGTTTVVQVAQESSGQVENREVAPDATPEASEPEANASPQDEPSEELVTPAQMRKIGALIGEWEQAEGRKLDRDERRRLIGFMAGVADPDALASAKDLTRAQASAAIDALTAEIEAAGSQDDVVDGEVVEETMPGAEQ